MTQSVALETEEILEEVRPEWTKIWVPKLEEIQAKVDKVNVRCTKLGLPLMALVVNSRYMEEKYMGMVGDRSDSSSRCLAPIIERPFTHPDGKITQYTGKPAYYAVIDWAEIKIAGAAPKLAGWSLVARVEGFEGGNLLHVVPGEVVPVEFRTRNASDCDHCKKARVRKDTFILRNEDGHHSMVGRNCIKDFLGHNNPDDILWLFNQYMMELSGDYMGEGGEEGFGGIRWVTVFDTIEVLAVTAAIVEVHGFVSRKASEEKMVQPTSELVNLHYNGKDWEDKETGESHTHRVAFTEAHVESAKAVLAWMAGTTEDSDYMQNMRMICGQARVAAKHLGYVCSAISAYNKFHEIQDLRQRHGAEWAAKIASSQYIGTVGKREDFEVLVVSMKSFDSDFGTKTLIKLEDKAANVLVWWSSGSGADEMEIGKWYKIKATVKSHADYKGLKQTTLSRAKVLGEAPQE